MPLTPTAQPGLIPVPGSPDVAVVAVDLGADAYTPQIRAAALDRLRAAGLEQIHPGAGTPPAVTGWAAQFVGGRLVLRSPDQAVYDGTLVRWPALTTAITANSWILVYVGHLALGWGADSLAAVRAAAARGDVLGGIVSARCSD